MLFIFFTTFLIKYYVFVTTAHYDDLYFEYFTYVRFYIIT
ncbi:hypothetical protein XSR1_170027 [Xenorhabdus szentirmaii DSM 16338]|uniref:Uncharacterized protein n=1 Tax=Xenorhabdus szentirmaii DSM 16338 TaxID=1427518 RepID=W1IVS4_9GAMM|nr:hypothetical protein XSR1_170027 [Xenorhabdus szentirmaii DSM 16338]